MNEISSLSQMTVSSPENIMSSLSNRSLEPEGKREENTASAIYYQSKNKEESIVYGENNKINNGASKIAGVSNPILKLLDNSPLPTITSGMKIRDFDGADLGFVSEIADISALAYKDDLIDTENFHNLNDNEIKELGIDPTLLINEGSGMYSKIFKSNNSEQYVVSFRGSEFPNVTAKNILSGAIGSVTHDFVEAGKDWGNDFIQAAGLASPQYANAKNLAEHLKSELGDNVIFTGHSLGGGLATIASLSTGNKAYTFNSAAVANNTLKQLGLPDIRASQGENAIAAFYVQGEPLASVYSLLNQTVDIVNPAKAEVIGSSYEIPVSKPLDFFNPAGLHQSEYISKFFAQA